MKAHTFTYRGKKYEFRMENGELLIDKISSLPKAVLAILQFGAAREEYKFPPETAEAVHCAVGNFIGPDGVLNEKGKRVFAQESEVMAAASTPTPPPTATSSSTLADTTPDAPLASAASGAEQGAASFNSSRATPDGAPNSAWIASSATVKISHVPRIAVLLNLIQHFLLRFMVFRHPDQAIVITLWIAHTWVIDAFRITPYLYIDSPTKRCGKSLLLDCLKALVCRGWLVANVTEATLMRTIDAENPTVLLDEIDALYRSSVDKSKEGLRAILNCGFLRGATVPRCSGREIKNFSVFGPKAFAGFGNRLADTVKDRSIWIQLLRRAKDQPVEKFRLLDVAESTKAIVEGLTSWAADEEVIRQLQASRPAVPPGLGDRAADIAEPLLAIAGMAGREWAESARTSLLHLLQENDAEEAEELGVRLLRAIREIFVAYGKKQMPTVQLLQKLSVREEAEPWTMQWPREFAGGNTRGPAAKLAALIRPYGIAAGTIRIANGTTPKGYKLVDFTDAFDRYLPPLPKKDATTPQGIVAPSPDEPNDEEKMNDHGA